MVSSLAGRTALVTGGASGIGAEVTAQLQANGVRVASLDVADGGPAEVRIRCDVADEESLSGAVAEAAVRLGGVHYAFVNAGVAGMGTVLTLPMHEWDRVTGVNLRGAFMTLQQSARAILTTMQGDRATGIATDGAIVVTAASAGIHADVGSVHYSVAKSGITQLVRIAARELGPKGIRVNAVAPGPTRTPMTAEAHEIPGYREALIERTPLGRLGEAGDIAEAVLAMFSLRWVTGQTLAADGGITLTAPTDVPGMAIETLESWFNA